MHINFKINAVALNRRRRRFCVRRTICHIYQRPLSENVKVKIYKIMLPSVCMDVKFGLLLQRKDRDRGRSAEVNI
jgi:hypothetical protein